MRDVGRRPAESCGLLARVDMGMASIRSAGSPPKRVRGIGRSPTEAGWSGDSWLAAVSGLGLEPPVHRAGNERTVYRCTTQYK
jgi:hypothetical protein